MELARVMSFIRVLTLILEIFLLILIFNFILFLSLSLSLSIHNRALKTTSPLNILQSRRIFNGEVCLVLSIEESRVGERECYCHLDSNPNERLYRRRIRFLSCFYRRLLYNLLTIGIVSTLIFH